MKMKGNTERQPPLLLMSHGEHYEKQSFYNVLENCSDTTTIPILCNKYVLASSYGWLVLVDTHTNNCCLWNPESMGIIELPELRNLSEYSTCVLSKPPTEPGCHILFNSASKIRQAFCQIGDDEFARQSLVGNGDVQSLWAMESFHGNIYGLVGHTMRLVTIHFVGKTLEWRPLLKKGQPWRMSISSRPWATNIQDYLIESPCHDELLLVRKMQAACHIEYCCDFKVFRVDTNRKKCVELVNIGEQSIFLSYLGQAFCCSSTGIKPNSIYYTLGELEGRILYIYDLGNRGTTWLTPCPAARRSQSRSYWIEPRFSIK